VLTSPCLGEMALLLLRARRSHIPSNPRVIVNGGILFSLLWSHGADCAARYHSRNTHVDQPAAHNYHLGVRNRLIMVIMTTFLTPIRFWFREGASSIAQRIFVMLCCWKSELSAVYLAWPFRFSFGK